MQLEQSVQDSQMQALWDRFFNTHAEDAQVVVEGALNYPEQRSITITKDDLDTRCPELVDALLERPQHVLRIGEAAMWQVPVTVEPKPRLNLRVVGFPESSRVIPRQLRSEHLGKLVSVHGIIMTMTKAYPRPVEATFECKFCGNQEFVLQSDDLMTEPSACSACQKTGPWRFRDDLSRWADVQYLTIQEPPDAVRGGSTPEAVSVELVADLVHSVDVGDHVVINGTLTARRRRHGQHTKIDFDNYLAANSVERINEGYADTEIPPELEERFLEISKRPDIHQQLARCYMPSVSGMDSAKMAILFAMAGAPTYRTIDGKRHRGELHVLIAGDPGMAKTALIGGLDAYAPRVVHVEGSGASGAGIAAAVDHDKQDKSWIMRAGALVQADGGICAFDEMGQMKDDDHGHLNTAMESGIVRISKVVKADLRAETTVIGAMNPKVGERFDRYGPPPIAQLGLRGALLSRFDLIFCYIDRVDQHKDRDLARAMLRPAAGDDVKDVHDLLLSPDEFRRYIAWIRRIPAELSEEASQVLEDEYVRIRAQDSEHATITARQNDAYRRLAIASARVRASAVADVHDAERAIHLMSKSFQSCGIIDATGHVDGDLLLFGVPRDQHERQRVILQLIKDLCREHPDGYLRGHAEEADVIERAEAQGISEDDVRRGIQQMSVRNTIYARGGNGRWAPLAS